MQLGLVVRLLLIGILISATWAQVASGLMSSECLKNFLHLTLSMEHFKDKYLSFSAVDQSGIAWELDEALASQCGYTITYSSRNSIVFRASALSCHSHLEKDVFTVTVKIKASHTSDMKNATTYLRSASCPYRPWSPRELVCETNYMEVSARRDVPQTEKDIILSEPEDWILSYPKAKAGEASVWQILFHQPEEKRALLVSDAWRAGYGLNSTETRILLRVPYNTAHIQLVKAQGITFSAVRSSTFYKQQWMILMVDTAVACPVDGVNYTNKTIIWTVPKYFQALCAGATDFKDVLVEAGVNLHKLSAEEMASRKYVLSNDINTITMKIPIGAEGGSYKTSVSSGKHGAKYSINLFLEHQWEDNKWGLTKYTIIKEIETPFEQVELAVTNNLNLSARLMNVTVGMFLLDVELVNLTIEGTTVTVPEAIQHGYLTYEIQYANGSKIYVIQVSFDAPGIKKEYVIDDTREYTLNVTLKFIILPTRDTFSVPIITVSAVKDAVLPSARGFCDENDFHLIITHGNVDQNWLPFISEQHLVPEVAQEDYYSLNDNGTHLTVSVPFLSSLVDYKDIHISGVMASLHLTLKDGITLANKKDFSISCRFPPSELIQCLPNGTVVITAIKLVRLADLDTSLLVLRDKQCKPSLVTKKTATFKFNVNTCGTSRKFNSTSITYENDILYFRPGNDIPVYQLRFVCVYTIKHSADVHYENKKNLPPSIKPGFDSLDLSLKLFKEKSYSEPYQELEYPVVKYLREALYFEVELLQPADPRLELNLEDCWATNSQSQDSLPRWPILINGCERSEDSYRTVFHEVNYSRRVKFPQHLKRFEVTVFTFVQGTALLQMQLYLHCSVVICSTTPLPSDVICQRGCNPGTQRLDRHAELHSRGHVSSGAVLIRKEKLASKGEHADF
ncbi:zona pellucida protein precursor [Gallus gallus]|uniref:Zona pellucida protein n=1 Tax=Gallus gallus TaxID=9031 RepID=A0A8V0XDR7_CHICK|nr:zona pellucida protein precursor [Gallus gallus]|eukprot:XP_015140443.1 zona pellucida protein isoform X1 [Gallus gallus]